MATLYKHGAELARCQFHVDDERITASLRLRPMSRGFKLTILRKVAWWNERAHYGYQNGTNKPNWRGGWHDGGWKLRAQLKFATRADAKAKADRTIERWRNLYGTDSVWTK